MIDLAVWGIFAIELVALAHRLRQDKVAISIGRENLVLRHKEHERVAQRDRQQSFDILYRQIAEVAQDVKARLVMGGRFDDAIKLRDRLHEARESFQVVFHLVENALAEPAPAPAAPKENEP